MVPRPSDTGTATVRDTSLSEMSKLIGKMTTKDTSGTPVRELIVEKFLAAFTSAKMKKGIATI